jgi:hypothetical protein
MATLYDSRVHIYSIERNGIRDKGESALVKAIAENDSTAISHLQGFDLTQFWDLLGLPPELNSVKNEAILAQLQQLHATNKIKSARGGTR